MKIVKDNKYQYIEQAVGIDMNIFVDQLTTLINKIKVNHSNLLVNVHQYTGTTILDTTNFFETPINYKQNYPNIDGLISISQCAGFGLKSGTWIIPTGFMTF